ncbi:MAG TPA: hypothetical protein VEW95_10220 [Candidatus Limnocylindrales bacterium]|nr:hypothetical protein [Candidatus Limnocylindrales bacterium]
MPTIRPTPAAALLVASSVVAASVAGILVDRAGGTPPLTPAAAALVIALCFWWRAPEGLVAFGVFALLAETIEHWTVVDLLLFDEIALVMLAGVGIVRYWIPNGRLRIGVAELALVVLALSAVASSVLNGVPFLTWTGGLVLLFKGIAFLYLVSWLRLGPADAERIGVLLLIVTGAVAVFGLMEWIDPSAFQRALGLPPFEEVRGEVNVVKSIFLHPAQFGWLTAFGSLILYARFLVRRSWWALPLAIALNLGTIVSGRRTPVLGALIGLVAGIAAQVRGSQGRDWSPGALLRSWGPVVLGIAVLAIVTLPVMGGFYRTTVGSYIPPAEPMLSILSDEPDAELISAIPPRTALYVGAVAVARDHVPLGAGLGRFGSHLSRADYSPVYAEYGLDRIHLLGPDQPSAVTDTYWPMVLGETGLLGLLAALVFFGALTMTVWRNASTAASPAVRVIALAALMIFVEGLVRSFTASVFTAPPIAYFVLGAAGLSISVRRSLEQSADDPEPHGALPRPAR